MGARCAAAGCGRFVARGDAWCGRHRVVMSAGDRGPPDIEAPEFPDESEPGAIFRERLARGDYRSLLDPELWEVITAAGAERGLANEIGLLRVVLARLLVEESDPGRLAQNAARVAGVLVQAARAQHALSGEMADGLAEAVTHILAEFGE
jgi:hypothetical protein